MAYQRTLDDKLGIVVTGVEPRVHRSPRHRISSDLWEYARILSEFQAGAQVAVLQ